MRGCGLFYRAASIKLNQLAFNNLVQIRQLEMYDNLTQIENFLWQLKLK